MVREPCPAIEKILFIYLAYIRPFGDFLSHQLGINPGIASNAHLFTRHDSESACFSSSDCLRSLQESTPESPVPLDIRTYRHVAIAMSKKHLPALLRPFDPHTPTDFDGFLRLLAFQAGHKPSTHADAYVLETAFPAKLQPDLIHRYLENSRIWHEFALIRENDYVQASVDCSLHPGRMTYETLGYFPDPPDGCREVAEPKQDDSNIATCPCSLESEVESDSDNAENICPRSPSKDDNTEPRNTLLQIYLPRGQKRKPQDISISPTSKKIRQLQHEITKLVQSRRGNHTNKNSNYPLRPVYSQS